MNKQELKTKIYKHSSGGSINLIYVMGLIDQLEEPEITREQVNEYLYARDMSAVDNMLLSDTVGDNVLVEKPVIPEFVGNYIDSMKKTKYPLLTIAAVANRNIEADSLKETYDWIRENPESFFKAWLGGYVAEEEKRYKLKLNLPQYPDTYMAYVRNQDEYRLRIKALLKHSEENKSIFLESELEDIDETGFVRVEVTE